MKIYWLICLDTETKERSRCFFRTTEDEIKADVDFRLYEEPIYDKELGLPTDDTISWEYEVDEVQDDKFGYCINHDTPALALPYAPDCSVGMVRKYRNNVENDDGTCGTCPYYSKEKPKDDC